METSPFFLENQNRANRNISLMVYQFICTDSVCAEKEGGVFQMEVPFEAIMDEKNMAMTFCRRCGKPLHIEQRPRIKARGGE